MTERTTLPAVDGWYWMHSPRLRLSGWHEGSQLPVLVDVEGGVKVDGIWYDLQWLRSAGVVFIGPITSPFEEEND